MAESFRPNAQGIYNPQCQLIVNGVRCNRPAHAVHHLIDPNDRPDLALSPANTVGLCRSHHDNRHGEDPNEPREFAPTRWIMSAEYPHPKPDASSHAFSTSLTADGKIKT